MSRDPGGRRAATQTRYFFIRRPILSSVISIVIVPAGPFAMKGLPIASYPRSRRRAVSLPPPIPGATAKDVAEAVAAPIEQQLAGLEDCCTTSRPMPATAR